MKQIKVYYLEEIENYKDEDTLLIDDATDLYKVVKIIKSTQDSWKELEDKYESYYGYFDYLEHILNVNCIGHEWAKYDAIVEIGI